MWKRIAIVVAVVLVAAAAYVFWPESADVEHLADAGAEYDVVILRDTWGVPHIFGTTDADVAFGLAYAHAEDDFLTIQQSLAAARGQLGFLYGMDAVANDYMVHLLRIWDVVEANYDTLSPEVRAICEAYAAGLNRYAGLHPQETLVGLFPVTGRDVVAGSVHKLPLFYGLDHTLGELFASDRQNTVSPRSAGQEQRYPQEVDVTVGSNTFAISPIRSSDGQTFLAVNSHQPWQGPVAWYEAHLHSEEGWDAVGGLFPGMPVIGHGHNRNVGWAFTVNGPDLADVYVLEINPENENQYRFDGEWLDLEVRQAPLTVKLIGRLRWTVKREVLWSVYGPVVRQDHGTYALRFAGYGEVGLYEQFYRLNRAQSFEDWQAAMRMQTMPNFNVAYADGEGNIYYLYNARVPIRSEFYDWSQYLPGDTSETLWTEFLPFDQLPQVLNPPSGFVQNCNTTPFSTTLPPYNPNPADYSATFGIGLGMNNRGTRALELFSGDLSITEDEFYTYKYDMSYSSDSRMAQYVQTILEAPMPDDPNVQQALDILAEWDLRTNPESLGATIGVWTYQSLGFPYMDEIGEIALTEGFVSAVNALVEAHGRVDIPWSDVNRLRRGDVDLGLGGGPDILHAVHGSMTEDGYLVGRSGDSYVMLVTWDSDGNVSSRSIHQYGSATLDTTSPHYSDQAYLFVQRELKPVWMDEAEIRANLEMEYRPGEEVE